MAEYRRSIRYEKIADRIIAKKMPELANIRIGFLTSEEEKKQNKKIICGQCHKVNDLYKPFCPYDFLIVIYEMNILNFDAKQRRILIEHELRHVGIDDEGNETKFYVVPHDREEFDSIIDEFGLKWDEMEE